MADRANPMEKRAFRRKLWLARATLAFERLYPAVFPVLLIAAGFVLASLFDLWRLVPVWLHALVLLGCAAGAGYCLLKARPAFAWPSRDSGLARLERDSNASHQPLRMLEDRLPEGTRDPMTGALWQRHRARVLAALDRIRLAPPRSAMPTRDPWAGRALVLLLLVVGAVEARGELGQRLLRGLTPGSAAAAAVLPVEVTMWVTPPTYTRRPPLTIEQTRRMTQLDVPSGSETVVQLHNLGKTGEARPSILFNGAEQELAVLGEQSVEVRLTLESAGLLEVVPATGDPLASWQIAVMPDLPPSISFTAPPGATYRRVLEVAYEASDDYGLRQVALNFALVGRAGKFGQHCPRRAGKIAEELGQHGLCRSHRAPASRSRGRSAARGD